jgi:ribosomal subunit interface protein
VDVIVRGNHWDVPDTLAERARRKLARLDRYLPLLKDGSVEVDFAHERTKEPDQRFVLRVSVAGGGVRLRTEERASRPEAAVDQAANALSAQARRHKQRLYERGRAKSGRRTARAAPADGGSAVDDDSALDKIAKVERVAVKPMSSEEAVEQMDLFELEFLLFHDVDVGTFSLLYRGKNGTYRMIIPELP